MAVTAIGGVQAAAGTASSSNLGVSQLDFLKILTTQLSFQDPLKPIDNQEFIGQLAQFTTLAQTKELSDKIDSLVGIQASSQLVGLLNRTVEVSSAGGPVQGTVTTLSFDSSGAASLTLRLADGSLVTGVNPSSVTLVR